MSISKPPPRASRPSSPPPTHARAALERLGLGDGVAAVRIGTRRILGRGAPHVVRSPIDGSTLTRFPAASVDQVDEVIAAAAEAFRVFRTVPAPRRGELVRRFAVKLREHKDELAELVSWEAGKIVEEARGEVQEMIDICDFAVGLSRQLYGLTIASERPGHRLSEQWHPLGPVGVITAFNFPVAVWAWNAALALVCGDPVIWKPSEKTPLSALACHGIFASLLPEFFDIPPEVVGVVVGDGLAIGERLAASEALPLVSATGSTRMGRSVASRVASRLGRTLLELGGNNGMIVTPSADPELTLRSVVFAAVGTAGQRCTSLRRLIIHRTVADRFVPRLAAVYSRLAIGNPLESGTLVGPLIDEHAFSAMQRALEIAKSEGGKIVTGGDRVRDGVPDGGVYVRPAIVEIDPSASIVKEETFAPILYVHRYAALESAIEIHNSVPQGLSSSIMTMDMREAELFCSAEGSDCGIVNVNTGTSGAEIGGAFGGEKQTGGGRESGSDAWKAYMRRATNTVNYSAALPLAQGIKFEV